MFEGPAIGFRKERAETVRAETVRAGHGNIKVKPFVARVAASHRAEQYDLSYPGIDREELVGESASYLTRPGQARRDTMRSLGISRAVGGLPRLVVEGCVHSCTIPRGGRSVVQRLGCCNCATIPQERTR